MRNTARHTYVLSKLTIPVLPKFLDREKEQTDCKEASFSDKSGLVSRDGMFKRAKYDGFPRPVMRISMAFPESANRIILKFSPDTRDCMGFLKVARQTPDALVADHRRNVPSVAAEQINWPSGEKRMEETSAEWPFRVRGPDSCNEDDSRISMDPSNLDMATRSPEGSKAAARLESSGSPSIFSLANGRNASVSSSIDNVMHSDGEDTKTLRR